MATFFVKRHRRSSYVAATACTSAPANCSRCAAKSAANILSALVDGTQTVSSTTATAAFGSTAAATNRRRVRGANPDHVAKA